MQLVLVFIHRDEGLGMAWKKYFDGQPNVEIVAGDICEVSADAIVSPANSFGFMDGGLDLALSDRFGWDLQERLQEMIRRDFYGELHIGQAAIIATRDERVPWLISAPTMRVPMRIRDSVRGMDRTSLE